jgi:hypothetical protein
MSMGLAPASENPVPMYTTPPPSQQPMDLAGALSIVTSIIFRDGWADPNEKQIFSTWLRATMMQMQAQASQLMQAQGPPPAQAQGLGATSAPQGGTQDYNPFGNASNPNLAPAAQGSY